MLRFLYSPTLHPYMTTGNTIAFTRWTFVSKEMSLLFNMLSGLVITFLPRIKCLLISRLQRCPVLLLRPPVPLGFTSAVSGSGCNSIHFHSLQESASGIKAVCVLSLYSPV